MRIGPSGARRYYTKSEAPAELLKYPQTFDPCCPPPFTGGKFPDFGPNFDPSRFRTAVFLNWGALSENKNKLVKDRWYVYHHTKLGAMGTPKSKISYIFSIPAAHAEYTATNVIPPIGTVADVKRLPCLISQFASYILQGAKISSPTRVNLGPHHVLETITDRKLKFYIHLHRVKYTFGIWKFFR